MLFIRMRRRRRGPLARGRSQDVAWGFDWNFVRIVVGSASWPSPSGYRGLRMSMQSPDLITYAENGLGCRSIVGQKDVDGGGEVDKKSSIDWKMRPSHTDDFHCL